jgi:class 3 adenylate cyclase
VRSEAVETPPGAVAVERITNLIVQAVWGLTLLLIVLRAPASRETRAIFAGFALYTLSFTQLTGGPAWAQMGYIGVWVLVAFLAGPLFVLAYVAFPAEAGSLRGKNLWWPWIFLGSGLPAFAVNFGMPFGTSTARMLAPTPVVPMILAIVTMLTLNYRKCGPVGRRKVKWIILAVYLGSLQGLIQIWLLGGAPADPPLWSPIVTMVANLLFPMALLIAISRFDLFDIDRLIGATVAYNILGIVIMGSGFLILPSISDMLAGALGFDPTFGRSAVALSLAGVVVVAQRKYGSQVDRVFFKERFAFEEAMRSLPERLGAARDAQQLWTMTGTELSEHLRPTSCIVFASADDAFVPVFTEGDVPSLAVPAEEGFVAWMASLPPATAVDRKLARSAGPVGTAVLAGLEPQVLLPIRRSGELEAFTSLGEKRSGDIYTRTDVTLLATLSQSLSIHLLRFTEGELLERSRAMQEKMRRYVPGALAEEIELGRDLETGEREVSVLFVDIRGYTAYAQGKEVADVFSTVNRYTEMVSSIVRDCGGAVVEFNGDGMMAVFGAPRPLAAKETAAVTAARRLVDEVPRLRSADGAETAESAESTETVETAETVETLTVGVGVATGPAFVGNIEAVDRVIWSALGSTTNLAARLQTLTRDYGASVIIDDLTHERCGASLDGFTRHGDVTLRGRRGVSTVYVLTA